MTTEEVFDEFTQSAGCGPRLDTSPLPEAAKSVFGWHARNAASFIGSASAHCPRLPPIHFDWVSNPEVNAWAFRHRGQYFIGITDGAIGVLNLFINRLLCHPNVLTHVGDPSRETAGPVLSGFTANAHSMFTAGHRPEVPQDETRSRYARHLQDLAVALLVGHELTHIVNGHVDLVRDRLGLPFVAELGWAKSTAMPAVTRQTLEMDADCGAVCHQIGTIRIKLTDPERKPPPPWDSLYQSPAESLFDWAIAAWSFFRLFGDDMYPGMDLAAGHYPPFRVRQLIAIATAVSFILEKWDHTLAKPCSQRMADASVEVERAFSTVTGEPVSIAGVKQAWGGSGWKHIEGNLLSHWKTQLRGELQPFAYTSLPE